MDLKKFILNQNSDNDSKSIEYKILEDADVLILNGSYKDMKLSDIYVISPKFIDKIINDYSLSDDIKECAIIIKEAAEICMENIATEIALNS